EVVAVQEYLATVEFANSRAGLGRWFSAHRGLDLELPEYPIDRLSSELLRDPDVVFRWDGGDYMPAAVGSATLTPAITDWNNGQRTEATLNYIEASWKD